ncbi:serine/threonine protein kinase [Sulfuricella sp.]|uniref:serine/threonine protein kinase n=1 Tax=Sulfuricella sp. TaxID=2099377 RepID=UPI002C5643F5|nr:serine/threonine protein kinase [Sulfuricella sp.]HUX63376.1 serine/threonine protein kinase [Sulfuricella sp.]
MATVDTPSPPYQDLTPDRILNAVESLGLRCDGRLLALNSYENRVYQVGIEESAPVIAKFYRPLRWTDEAILEEHRFTLELAEREIPVVAPLVDKTGRTLHEFEGFRFTISPRQPGRAPELDDPDTLEWMGRFIGRIHAVGAIEPFAHRPTITIETFGVEPYRYIIANGFIPPDLEAAYTSTVEDALQRVRTAFARAEPIALIRLHGDCHPGNVLWSDTGPHFVDFDDCRMGPAVQDIWMLLSGDRTSMTRQLSDFMEGYKEFHDFNSRELLLVEALRTLRLIHYAGWLAQRWSDPAFPASFPWFNTQRYWQDQILALREQAALMDEPPLVLG